jgi:ATP-binding cassette, subfamily C (CFTR/MRP), member 1
LSKKGKRTEPVATVGKVTYGSIFPAMHKSYGGPFWFAGFLQIVMIALTFASPILLDEIITYTSPVLASPLWQGLVLTFAIFLVNFLNAILNGQYFHRTFVVGFRIRTGLISAIYRKALRISNVAKKDTTVGEIVNLMSVDAQRFFEMVSYLHVLWSGPVTIGIAIWLLWRIIGVAVMAGLAVMILMIPLSGIIAAKLRDLQIIQMKVKDERVKSMNEILNGMKVLKVNLKVFLVRKLRLKKFLMRMEKFVEGVERDNKEKL